MVIATPAHFVNGAMQRQARHVSIELRSGLLDLAIISRVAPMLGLFGTASSMLVIVFRAVHPPDDWIAMSAVSGDIYSALLPILLGLGVGLLAGLGHLYLRGQADTLSAQVVGPEPKALIAPGVLGFVERAMERKARLVSLQLESRLHHLAIIASVAPLLGFFLTLWIIGGCFPSIGGSRSSLWEYTIGCLGDNLIWTLVGLFVGITASFARKLLLAQADALKAEMSSISHVLLSSLPKV